MAANHQYSYEENLTACLMSERRGYLLFYASPFQLPLIPTAP